MDRVLITHACGHPHWQEIPALEPVERKAVKARLGAMVCPRCWCGSDESYVAAWGRDARTGPANGGRR